MYNLLSKRIHIYFFISFNLLSVFVSHKKYTIIVHFEVNNT